MSMILDVLVIATLLICMILYTKRGFVKGILGLFGCLIAMIAASLTKGYLEPYLLPSIERTLDAYDGSDGYLSQLLQADLSEKLITTVIAFTLLFVLYIFVVKLVTFLLDRICHLPVLKQANGFLGFLLGTLIGLIYVQLLSIFLFTFSELLIASQDWLTREAFEGSVIARWMFDHNLFLLLMDLL